MKKKIDLRLCALEDAYFFSLTDAHDVVRVLSEAASQHVPAAHHALLVSAYARIVEETFRFQEWLTSEGLTRLTDALLAVTLRQCSYPERQRMHESLNQYLQEQGEWHG